MNMKFYCLYITVLFCSKIIVSQNILVIPPEIDSIYNYIHNKLDTNKKIWVENVISQLNKSSSARINIDSVINNDILSERKVLGNLSKEDTAKLSFCIYFKHLLSTTEIIDNYLNDYIYVKRHYNIIKGCKITAGELEQVNKKKVIIDKSEQEKKEKVDKLKEQDGSINQFKRPDISDYKPTFIGKLLIAIGKRVFIVERIEELIKLLN